MIDFNAGEVWLVIGLVSVIGYLIPTYVAFFRRHPNRWAIFVINLVFGGTGIGWLGSLVWAMGAVHRSPTGSHGGESGLNIFANDPVPVTLDQPVKVEVVRDDGLDRLARLKALRDAGAIDEHEYRTMREQAIREYVGS